MTEKEWLEYQSECENFKYGSDCVELCKIRHKHQPCGFVPFIPEYLECKEELCPNLK